LATRWLDATATSWRAPQPDPRWQAAATALWARSHARAHGALAGWSSTGPRTTFAALASGEARWQARVVPEAAGDRITIDGHEHRVSIVADDRIEIDGQCLPAYFRWQTDAGV